MVEAERPDLVLLDVGLPDMDGYAVLREVRAFSGVPVIMLTARDEAIDKVRGLEARRGRLRRRSRSTISS